MNVGFSQFAGQVLGIVRRRQAIQGTNFVLACLFLLAGSLPARSQAVGSGDPLVRTQAVTYQAHGLNFSPYKKGQDPNLLDADAVSPEQLRERMAIIAPYTQWVRTFGSTRGLEQAGRIARDLKLKVAVGAWLGPENNDAQRRANEQELANALAVAKAGHADMVVVGTEVLLRGDLTEKRLLTYLFTAKQELKGTGIPVTTAEVYYELLSRPSVLASVDVVGYIAYPYWEGVSIDTAIGILHGWHQKMKAAAGGKRVVLMETGWPSCGNQIGEALPSLENASRYWQNFVSWARANEVEYFYFDAFDEGWKEKYEGPQGACWGIWDEDGNMNPGMQDPFDGKVLPDNWGGTAPIDGPGNPEIEFTFVPEYDHFEDLRGHVRHVMSGDCKVAVYIQVEGKWWTKPLWNHRWTPIAPEGSWVCDITTGGIDEKATQIAAFLIPNRYDPPLMSGGFSLPSELVQRSLARVYKERRR